MAVVRARRGGRRAASAAAAAAAAAVAACAPRGATAAAGFPAGARLELAACSSTDPAQTFAFTAGGPGGPITHPASTLCIEAFPGSDYGWDAENLVLPCVPNAPWQTWTVDPTGGTVRTNSTVIVGCLGFNMWQGGTPAAGTRIGPYPCGTPPSADEVFSFNNPFAGAIQVMGTDGVTPSGFCVAVAVPATSYTLDDTVPGALGPEWDGLGVVAGAGTARLLFDYPDATRSAILDALFKPGVGLSAQLLKVEIGGDGMASSGSEPAHQHFQGEPSQAATRGSQVWLATQARARNPSIKLYALPWSWPGWLRTGPSDFTPFSAPYAAAAYVRDWLTAVRSSAGLQFDYVGIYSDIWDTSLSPTYVKTLRTYLDGAGLNTVKIVCADVNEWACANAVLADPDLAAAVDILGDHSTPPSTEANQTGKPLWRSWVNIGGAADLENSPRLAGEINRAFVRGNQSGTLAFAAMGSSYNTLPEWNYGAILADQPWSGFWRLMPTYFSIAHTTQFTAVGWTHLVSGAGSGFLANGGTYVTRVNTASGGAWQWSTVVAKMVNGGEEGITAEMATFVLGATNLGPASPTVYVTTTCFGGTGTNTTFWSGPTAITVFSNAFTVWLAENCLYSITNVAGAGATPPPYPAAVVPTPFPQTGGEDFTDPRYTAGMPGQFWSDINGAFEIVDDPAAGRGLQAKAGPGKPVTRRGTDTVPHTVLGDPQWQDMDFSVRVFLPSVGDTAGVCVRCSDFNDTAGVDGSSGADHMPGIWLFVNSTGWNLTYTLDGAFAPMRSAALAAPIAPGGWHTLRLLARGDAVLAFLDGFVLFRQNVTFATLPAPPTRGFIGLAAGGFGQYPIFGAYSYSAASTACSATPVAGAMPHQEPCTPGTPGTELAYTPAVAPATGGTFSLVADTTLCLTQNATADPQYRYQNTRAVILAPCNATDLRQTFTIETTMTDGVVSVGPITGIDGLTLNVFGNSDSDDADISGYTYQGGTNAIWWWDSSTGTLFAPYMGLCASFCQRM
jgi:galactosylceramidase